MIGKFGNPNKHRKRPRNGQIRDSQGQKTKTKYNHRKQEANPELPPSRDPDTPESAQQRVDTPLSERRDPNYQPPSTPRSRRELRDARPEPPLTGARTGAQTQDPYIAETSAIFYMRW